MVGLGLGRVSFAVLWFLATSWTLARKAHAEEVFPGALQEAAEPSREGSRDWKGRLRSNLRVRRQCRR